MSYTVDRYYTVAKYYEPEPVEKIVEPVVKPKEPVKPDESKTGDLNLYAGLRKTAVTANFKNGDVVADKSKTPTNPQEAFEQIKNLPVPDVKDTAGIKLYNQRRTEIALAGLENSKAPDIKDFSVLPGRLRELEYTEAVSHYNQSITKLTDIVEQAKIAPTKLPLDAVLLPWQALDRIKNLPVPDPKNAAALDQYIRDTQTIAQASLDKAQPPKRSDFDGLHPKLAQMEYQDAVAAYNQTVSELKPFADGISYVRYDKTADYMFGEMKNNLHSSEFKSIKDNLDLFMDPPLIPGDTTGTASLAYLETALLEFREQVKSDGPWDHKPILREMLGLKEGEDLRFPVRGDEKNEVFYDIWSNVHYGYIGKAAGFDDGTLQKAADISEHGTGTNDPVDKVTIQIGIDMWDKYGANMTKEQFEYELQARMSDIIKAQETQEYKDKNPDFTHVSPIWEGNGR